MSAKRSKPDNYKIRLVVKPQRRERGPDVTLAGEVNLHLGRMLWLLAINGCRSRASADAAALLLRELENDVPDSDALVLAGSLFPRVVSGAGAEVKP